MPNTNDQKAPVSPRYCTNEWSEEAYDLARAIAAEPNNIILRQQLAYTYMQLERFEEAMPEFDEILRLDPMSDFVFAMRGLVRGYLNDFEGALADFAHCLTISPQCYPAHFNRARVRFMMQDWDAAIQDYTIVLTFQPGEFAVLWRRAEIYCIIGNREKAFADYYVAINTAPEQLKQALWQNALMTLPN